MTAGNDPNNHHYIPRFYLRQWTGADHLLERWHRPTPGKIDVKRVSPKAVGFQHNLYRYPGDLRKPYLLETEYFQKLDDRAARALARLNSADPSHLSMEDMNAWCLFVYSLVFRTPQGMEKLMADGKRQWMENLDTNADQYAELKGERDPPTFAEYRALHTDDTIRLLLMSHLPFFIGSDEVGTVLRDMPKVVRQIDDPALSFLVSDSPLIRTNGLLIKGGHYGIPLSPRRFLISAPDIQFLRELVRMPDRELVKNSNKMVVGNALHFVAGFDRRQDRFIRNRFGENVVLQV